MKQYKVPAVFARGGTSKGILFHRSHLPAAQSDWDRIFLAALGSPDPYGRQLDGMGGGLSSLSKICVIGPPTRNDADVDYTFAQVLINQSLVDYSALCGNMSSTVGPFAVDEGLVSAAGRYATVRIHNTNTSKIITAGFPLEDGMAAVDGDLIIPGVYGSGAPVRLDFLDPGGATTGSLLPTGKASEKLTVPNLGEMDVSLVDASNACVFVHARDVGLRGTESPMEIEADGEAMRRLAAIRIAASLRMGVTGTESEAKSKTAVPFVGFVAPSAASTTLSGALIPEDQVDLVARFISNGQPHRALPLGASMCLAVAARITGTIVHSVTKRPATSQDPLRISMPSGILTVAAEVANRQGRWQAIRGSFFRTQRRLFEGHVLVRASSMKRDISPTDDNRHAPT